MKRLPRRFVNRSRYSCTLLSLGFPNLIFKLATAGVLTVAKGLETCNFGVLCITRENLNSPWILFEAGALAESMQDERVIPLLLDLDFKDLSGPLAQFQAKRWIALV